MKLNNTDFKRFKELQALIKAGKATEADKAEFASLQAKRNERGSNAIEWWKNYPTLLADVVNLPFNYIPGTPFTMFDEDADTKDLTLGVLAVANIRPAIGRSRDDNSAFNTQIRQLWLDMHRKYRGIGTYEKSDLGIMILSVNSVFATLAKFERIYGVINTYHVGNRVVPYALKEALKIDDTVEANLADFRYQLNLAITKLQQLCLPKGLSVLQSDVITLSNIFKDSANRRASLFLFDTDVFGVYDAASITDAGAVQYKFFEPYMTGHTKAGDGAFTLSDMITIINEQMNALLGDDDIARMCSDLIAAYGPENVMQLALIPTDYKVEPVEDYERQLQFHNLTICPKVQGIYEADTIPLVTANVLKDTTYNVIYQRNNAVRCELGYGGAGYYQSGTRVLPFGASNSPIAKNGDTLLDTWVDQPGEVEVMCGTRYTAVAGTKSAGGDGVFQELIAYGTQVCTMVEIYYYDNSTGSYQLHTFLGSVIPVSKMSETATWAGLAKLQQVDWHPLFYVKVLNHIEVLGDVDNFARITADNLARLHEVALLSGYKIPMVSRE